MPCRIFVLLLFVAAEANIPSIAVDGNASLTRQWTVLESNSVTFTTSDREGDTVMMYAWRPLPSGSSLVQRGSSDAWEFTWTPMNMDPVELV